MSGQADRRQPGPPLACAQAAGTMTARIATAYHSGSRRAAVIWSTSRSAQIKVVTVPDLDVLLHCECQPRACDVAELYRETGRWRPGPAAHDC